MKIKINEGTKSNFQNNVKASEGNSLLFEDELNKLKEENKIQKDINSKSKEYILVLENLISDVNNKEEKYVSQLNDKENEISDIKSKSDNLNKENLKLSDEIIFLKESIDVNELQIRKLESNNSSLAPLIKSHLTKLL